MSRPRSARAALLVALCLVAQAPRAADVLEVQTREPRAYGYQVGDLLQRQVVITTPSGWVLDPDSLPRPTGRGQAVELRGVGIQVHGGGLLGSGVLRHELVLDYQVFLAPAAPRTLEIAPMRLRLRKGDQTQELRVEAWPVTVAPLMPVEAAARDGLGEMQPDAPPPRLDTTAAQQRLVALLAVAGLLALGLAVQWFGPPWNAARRRPFAVAWRDVRGPLAQSGPDALLKRLHQALNQTAGEVVFAHNLPRFVAEHPGFAPLQPELASFLALSQRHFFGGEAPAGALTPEALRALCRRCRDAERGLA